MGAPALLPSCCLPLLSCLCLCVYVCMCAHVHVCAYMHACVYVCVVQSVYMHICRCYLHVASYVHPQLPRQLYSTDRKSYMYGCESVVEQSELNVKVAPLLLSSVTADPLMIVVLAIVLMAVAAIVTFNCPCCSTSSAQFVCVCVCVCVCDAVCVCICFCMYMCVYASFHVSYIAQQKILHVWL